jgi:NADH-quinone oxidoreductase subunit A
VYNSLALLQAYLPVLVFAGLGIVVGGTLVTLNHVLGPRRPNKAKSEPYECGLPSEISHTFRFGISFYMIAMLFILFDIEVVFLYPVGVILNAADSVFVLVEILVFVFLLLVAFAYAWRRGALDWR